jgi:protein gp37
MVSKLNGQMLINIASGMQRKRVFTDVLSHHERLNAPLHWKKPRRIFVNSMSDLFHEDVQEYFIREIFDVMRQCENGYSSALERIVSQHTFQILTKRPARMLDFCTRLRFAQNDPRGLYLAKELPHNGFNPMQALRHVWLGVSVEDQATADERIPLLLQTPAAVRFISYEPALGPINLRLIFPLTGPGSSQPAAPPSWKVLNSLTGYDGIDDHKGRGAGTGCPRIDWVIAGGESGPHARPSHPYWFKSLRDQCAAAAVPFFFKQWGEWKPRDEFAHDHAMVKVGKKAAGRTLDGRLHDEYPA